MNPHATATNPPSAIAKWFLLNGFITASWVTHIPRQTIDLAASPGPLSLALLCMAFGSVIGMAAATTAIAFAGAGRASWIAGAAYGLLLPLPLLAWSVPGLGLALLVFGIAHGLMDVTMNVAASACETDLGRPLMSSFHGWFSVGMVAGVGAGASVLAVGFTALQHAGAVIAFAAVLLLSGRPGPRGSPCKAAAIASAPQRARRQTVFALAGLAFVCLFLEGAMADWSGLLAAAFGAGPVHAPLAYLAFTTTWAAGRFVGDRLTAWTGDAVVIGAGGLLAAAGIAVALAAGNPTGVAVGCGVVGLGLANAIPVLFRAAAGEDATGRGLALVTGLGYVGFLVGPPLVGFTAEAVGLPRAMVLVIVGALLLALGAAVLPRRRTDLGERAGGAIDCQAVLFDMDGTLVDSTVVTEAVWREWSAAAGVDPAPILAIHHGRRPEETLRRTYPALATAEAAAWLQQEQTVRTSGIKPVTGAAELLDALAGRSWAVVTSASRPLAEARLRAAGLWRDAMVIGAEDVAEGKPSPEGYLLAARRLGVPPEQCVVIEDAPVGVDAGHRAGMVVVGVTTTHGATDLATPHIVRDLAAITVETGQDGAFRLVVAAAK